MRAIVVNNKVTVLRHRSETERLCMIRAERLALALGVEPTAKPVTERQKFETWLRATYTGDIDPDTVEFAWDVWQAAKQ